MAFKLTSLKSFLDEEKKMRMVKMNIERKKEGREEKKRRGRKGERKREGGQEKCEDERDFKGR